MKIKFKTICVHKTKSHIRLFSSKINWFNYTAFIQIDSHWTCRNYHIDSASKKASWRTWIVGPFFLCSQSMILINTNCQCMLVQQTWLYANYVSVYVLLIICIIYSLFFICIIIIFFVFDTLKLRRVSSEPSYKIRTRGYGIVT